MCESEFQFLTVYIYEGTWTQIVKNIFSCELTLLVKYKVTNPFPFFFILELQDKKVRSR